VLEGNQVTDRSVDPEAFGRFLTTIFDEWASRDVGEVFVQHFDTALADWFGEPARVSALWVATTRARAVAGPSSSAATAPTDHRTTFADNDGCRQRRLPTATFASGFR
jgi:sulfatase maturation enzyme AslB (radical SAM superfamily)